jgi:hypothetical protein
MSNYDELVQTIAQAGEDGKTVQWLKANGYWPDEGEQEDA